MTEQICAVAVDAATYAIDKMNIARHARRVVHIIDGELTEGKEATWA